MLALHRFSTFWQDLPTKREDRIISDSCTLGSLSRMAISLLTKVNARGVFRFEVVIVELIVESGLKFPFTFVSSLIHRQWDERRDKRRDSHHMAHGV